jgi:hypothetical protein
LSIATNHTPAANGLLPQTVPEGDIQRATAATAGSENVAQFAGPALATALVLGAGAGWAFALDAATFLISAALLVRIRPRARTGESTPAGESASIDAPVRVSVWQEIRAGAREVRSRTWVWATLASFCVALFCGLASWFVLGAVVAGEQYGHIGVYGVIEAATGLGAILGSFAGFSWRPRYPMRTAMLAMLIWPVAVIPFALGVTLIVVVPLNVLAGAGFSLFNVWWLTALAERIPPNALARVTSYDWMVSFALMPLGYLLAGPLAARLGAVNVLVGANALASAAIALGLVPREMRMLERLDLEEHTSARPPPVLPAQVRL